MNLIFCHSKKKCKNRWKCPNPKFWVHFHPSKIFFFCKKRFSLSFYTSKTIEKTLGHLILRTFAIFNPTYWVRITVVNIQGQRKHYRKQLAGFCLLEVTPRIRASPLSRWSAQTTFQCQIFLRDVSTMEASSLHGAPWLFVVGGDLQTALFLTPPWDSGRVEFLAICWSAMLLE